MANIERKLKVHFMPDDVAVSVPEGDNLLHTARTAGVHLSATCGGQSVCGTCRVLINKGNVESRRSHKITPDDWKRGYRLACRSRVMSDLEVTVPAESRLEMAVVRRETETLSGAGVAATGWRFNPPVTKTHLALPLPTAEDNISDLARLLRGLKEGGSTNTNVAADYEVLTSLPRALRKKHGEITVTTLKKPDGTRTITRVEAGDTSQRRYALASDIGTTTICGELLDLARGEVLARAMAYNGQIPYGADVITRIVHSQTPGGLRRLQKEVATTLNQVITELASQAGISARDIGHVTVAGNTTMTHLLLGLDPKYLRLAPYTPVAGVVPPVKARSLGIRLDESVYLTALPSVASYVGGDIVSGVVGAGLHQRQKLFLYIDIGTNGEMVVGNAEWLVTAACSAGPAFEGGGIRHGMMATTGAIEAVKIDPDSLEPNLEVIGGGKPRGICGSGLIAAVAELLKAGIIARNGKFPDEQATRRVRKGSDGYEYVLARAAETETGRDIVLTEIDIDNLMRAKAAMYAGYQTLIKSVGVSPEDIGEVIIAGAFGSHLDIGRAVTIGLLPDLPRERFVFIGNGSLTGARLVSFSTDLWDAAAKVATNMTNLELAERADFMDNYTAALFLPHTNAAEFPSIERRIRKTGKSEEHNTSSLD